MTIRVSIVIFSKNGAFSSFLGIGNLSACTAQAGPYNRYEFFLKIGFSRIIRVCQVFICAGRWRLVI